MTTSELHDLIVADPTAKKLADGGNDADCAQYLTSILPPVIVSTIVTERTIFFAFDDPIQGAEVLTKMTAAGQSEPVLAYLSQWLQPANGGLDIAEPQSLVVLDLLVSKGVLPQDQIDRIKKLATRPQVIDNTAVGAAWARYRTEKV